jgi:hypothetical protein
MRLVATGGIIGIDVVLAAVLVGQNVAGWIVGLVVGADLGDAGRAAVVLAAALAAHHTGPSHNAMGGVGRSGSGGLVWSGEATLEDPAGRLLSGAVVDPAARTSRPAARLRRRSRRERLAVMSVTR